MNEDEGYFTAFFVGMIVALAIVLAIDAASIKGDVINVDSISYVNVKVNDRSQWFEFDPTKPITFEQQPVREG